jgi:uncharacterized protein
VLDLRTELPIAILSLLAGSLVGCAPLAAGNSVDSGSLVRTEDLRVRKHVENWDEVKEKNVVMQDHEYTCGAAALATLMRYYFRDDVTEKEVLDEIQRQMPKAEWEEKFATGLSVRDLMRAARSKRFGYEAEARELKFEDLVELTAPVIVHLEKNEFQHFVVYRGVVEDRVYMADPILGNMRLPASEFQDQWTGVAMALSKEGYDPGDDHPLAVDKSRPARPELQVARRGILLRP